MAVTALDPETALVVIDLQKGLARYPTVHPVSGIVANAAKLARTFRSQRLPVVMVNVTEGPPGRTEVQRQMGDRPADFADIMDELDPQEEDIRVTKRSWGAFFHTDLEQRLRSGGVTQIVLAGIATSIGVESTAREAHALGFNVTLATDAMTDLDAEAHENSIVRIFPRLGETGSTAEIIRLINNI